MAMTTTTIPIRSPSPLHSSTLFSTTTPLSYIHSSQSSPTFCSCKPAATLTTIEPIISTAALAIDALVGEKEAVAFFEKEREALASAYRNVEVRFEGESRNTPTRRSRRDEVVMMRRKRRRARKGLSLEEGRGVLRDRVLRRYGNNGYFSREEEAELCLCLQEQARLEEVKRRIREDGKDEPTTKQLAEALRMDHRRVDKIYCRGRESQDIICRSFCRLVVSVASRYQGKGLSFQDLIQEGTIGLLKGAERFDSKKGCKLSTYVYWWIKESIIRALSNKSRIVRLPKSICEMIPKIVEANDALMGGSGQSSSYEQIAKVLDIKESTVRIAFEESIPPVSLNQPVAAQNNLTLQDIIPGPDETTPEHMVMKQLLKQELEELLQTVLTPREAHILRLHFGLTGQTPQSWEAIGRLLKLSRERVRQITNIAMSKLRQKSIIDNLNVYIV
nr:plastidic RNA polymerase sigma-subunit 4 [Passiflora biflora]